MAKTRNRLIWELRHAGKTYKAIAEVFGLSASHVTRICDKTELQTAKALCDELQDLRPTSHQDMIYGITYSFGQDGKYIGSSVTEDGPTLTSLYIEDQLRARLQLQPLAAN